MRCRVRSTVRLAVLLTLLGLIGFGASGCSLFGYAIGDMIDSGQEVDSAVDCARSAMTNVGAGDSVGIDLLDGGYLAGTFVALTPEDTSSYYERCLSFQKRLATPAGFPLPGDSILIVGRDGDYPIRLIGKFARYDDTGLWRYPVHGDLRATPYSGIDTVFSGDGGIVTGAWLREVAREGLLPLPGGEMSILSSAEVVRVPLDSVAALHVASAGNASLIGLSIGIVVDVACVAYAIIVASSLGSMGE